MEPNIVLFDIDNTLADIDHRLHYLKRDYVDWFEFEGQCVYDQPILPVIEMAKAFKAQGKQVWCWTGRTDEIRPGTEAWLRRYGVPFEQLLMRPASVEVHTESVPETKLRWLLHGPIPRDRVLCAVDDDPEVIKLLREEGGLLVLRVVRPKEGV